MIATPNCYTRKCIHFQGVNHVEDETQQVPICAAFPKGIPEEIAYGDNLHLEPYPGDHGIPFEEAKAD
jgi:hypothetical protein